MTATTKPTARRVSLEPLLRLEFANDDPDAEWPWNTAVAADFFKVSRAAIQRWARDGVTIQRADALACARGLNPAYVWDDWYDDVEHTCDACGAATRWVEDAWVCPECGSEWYEPEDDDG